MTVHVDITAGRWVRGDQAARGIGCVFCGWHAATCRPAACLFCGSVQCFMNGSGNGRCAVCFVGYLPGWSRPSTAETCYRRGCGRPAVARAPRDAVCTVCAELVKIREGGRSRSLMEYRSERLAVRDSGEGLPWVRWRFVPAAGAVTGRA